MSGNVDAMRAAVAQRYGLHFPEERANDLGKSVAAAARERGMAPAAFAHAFVAGGLARADVEALIARITVGETYFFRIPEANAILRDRVLPELLRRRAGTRRLRLWSAGCCTGEEPYTLAILLRESMQGIDDWAVSILATDLNPRYLEQAREGVYGAWSFRATPPETRRRHFHPTPDGRFAIDDAIRAMVTFETLNLCEPTYPSPANGTQDIDLILCRNVLMYFEAGQARAAAARLHAALADDGWMSVAPCEVSPEVFGDFAPIPFPGGTLYRKTPIAGATRKPAPPAATCPGANARAPSRQAAAPRDRVDAKRRQAFAGSDAQDFGARARALADQGRLREALALCTRWSAERKLDLQAHYLRALVAMELGEIEVAAQALQTCTYLAPDEPMVSHAAGTLARLLGRPLEAVEHDRHALDLLSARAPDAVVAHSDGLTTAQLMAHLRELLETEKLDGQAA